MDRAAGIDILRCNLSLVLKGDFMDELKIRTPLVKALISRILKKAIKKSLGCEVNIFLHDLSVTVKDGVADVRVEARGEIEVQELSRALKTAGLE